MIWKEVTVGWSSYLLECTKQRRQ